MTVVENVPVIAIDGPSGSGKGTVSRLLAERLGWHFLDSGSLYRVLALAASNHAVALDDERALAALATHLDVQFVCDVARGDTRVILESEDVSQAIRSEECGHMASLVAVIPEAREALLERQRAFRQLPGLVADGRDMGTVVFPDAELKIFLTASLEERARRRYNQLKEKGWSGSLSSLYDELAKRDQRDANRVVAPLRPAEDAEIVDTTGLAVSAVLAKVSQLWRDVKGAVLEPGGH